MRKKNIIFVGGIHGVGKTTLCQKISNRININYYSASELIHTLDKAAFNNNNKTVLDISGNQDKLITSINRYIDKTKLCLLDGHFCLLNKKNEIIKISEKTFRDIFPLGIIVFYDSVSNIRNKNFHRDKIKYDVGLLSLFQKEELERSKEISKKLEISYKAFDVNNDFQKIISFIKNLVKGSE